MKLLYKIQSQIEKLHRDDMKELKRWLTFKIIERDCDGDTKELELLQKKADENYLELRRCLQ